MKNRQLIYIPDIEPNTFLLFYFKGETGRSYSFRDYTLCQNPPKLTYAKDYSYSVDEIISMSKWIIDAESISTKNVDYWRKQIELLNQQYLGKRTAVERQFQTATLNHENASDNNELQTPQQLVTGSNKLGLKFSILNRNGQQIHSVDDWFRLAPPKMGIRHWKDGRSAKEQAKAWLKTGIPKMPHPLKALLNSHLATTSFVADVAIPEMTTLLDHFGGESRNHDLVLLGYAGTHKILISVEAKADEPFGKTIHKELALASPHSNVPGRIQLLSNSIFGRSIDTELGELRYQLLHGLAGALIEAKNQKAELAIFIVHEFISSQTNPKNVARNNTDFKKFIRAFPGLRAVTITQGKLIEGIIIEGGQYVPSDIPVLIGKAASIVDA